MQTAKLAVCIPEDSFGEKMGMAPRSRRRYMRLCKLLSAEERTRLKETAGG